MKSTKQIKLKLETHQLKIVRFNRQQKSFCEVCQMETQHLTVAQMAVVLAISEMNVFHLAIDGKFHLTETADGKLLICLQSAKN